ncbi:cysteine hydrolase family protein [Aureispira anguillae]|uniref:Cysteine hydrolase n=1 Tax=Aureispira anguillae TaxID=2864201 RepID=A0A915VMP6_9BACT|nr:isochorismatase family cysteine hydrolase [Aureispira anguillae]BDS09474.1 cysteine hydrolase [Aureispira anguillae]
MKVVFGIGAVILLSLVVCIYRLECIQRAISKGIPIDQSKRLNHALLIIDLQKDLTSPDGKMPMDLTQTDQIIERLNKYLKTFLKPNTIVIYIQQQYEKNWLLNVLTNNALLEQSRGVQLDERLIGLKGAFYLKKQLRDAFSNPKLDEILAHNKVGHLWISGIDASYCVNSTIEAAQQRNYKITVLEDLVGAKTKQKLAKQMIKWKKKSIRIQSTTVE